MSESETVSMELFQALLGRAGLNLSAAEAEALKPTYERFLGLTSVLHELDLGAEDMAVTFSSEWDPPRDTS